MHEPDFWTQCAEAMALQIEGRELIVAELTDLARQVWQDAVRKVDSVFHSIEQRRHLPPV